MDSVPIYLFIYIFICD